MTQDNMTQTSINTTKVANIDDAIEIARQEARAICAAKGEQSPECAAAWDSVEELQAEAAHQRSQQKPPKSAFQRYCEENPDADECRLYDD
ncbi:MAG: Calvin cycle protein CP12 [Snowella sp.]|nr:Calvin cycle protein CP12 [Snowella sp.]